MGDVGGVSAKAVGDEKVLILKEAYFHARPSRPDGRGKKKSPS